MRRRYYWRRFFSGARRTRLGRGGGLLLSAVLGIGLALALIWSLNARIKPVFADMAAARVTNAVTRKLEQAVSDYIVGQNITYQDIIILEKDEAGVITALTSNMTQLNTMKNEILIQATQAVESLSDKELSIPVGNLTGLSFLSGRGFSLPVRIVSVGTAHGEFRHSFFAAGINQTQHQIMLEISVTIHILLPGETLTSQVTTQVCAAETIIVGGVPDTYLNLGK